MTESLGGDESMDVLDRAIRRHGGRPAYDSVECVNFDLTALSGIVPSLKGLGRTFHSPRRISVEPHAKRTTFHDYPESGRDIVFDRGTMVVDGDRTPQYRSTFRGLRKLRRWDPVDAAYFFGYALVGYVAAPFHLQDLTRVGRDNSTHRVSLEYPVGSDTHSRRQRYHFASDGLLVRNDYHAEILGRAFCGAHFSLDYDESYAIPIATQRVVRLRLGPVALPVVVLRAELSVVGVS